MLKNAIVLSLLMVVSSMLFGQDERYQFVKGSFNEANIRADEHSTLRSGRIDKNYVMLRNTDPVNKGAARFEFKEQSAGAAFQMDFRILDETYGVDTTFTFIFEDGEIDCVLRDTSILIYDGGFSDGDTISVLFNDHTISFEYDDVVLKQFYTIAYDIKIESRIIPLNTADLYGEFVLTEEYIHPMMEVNFAQREIWIKEGEDLTAVLALTVNNTSGDTVKAQVSLISTDTPHFPEAQFATVNFFSDAASTSQFTLEPTMGSGNLGDNSDYIFEISSVEGPTSRIGQRSQLIVHVIESYSETPDAKAIAQELEPGDIVFIAYDNEIGGSGEANREADKIVLTNLVDIESGTKFQLAKGQYKAGDQKWMAPDGGKKIKDIVELTYTGSTALDFNSIICFDVGADGSSISDIRIDDEPAGHLLEVNAFSGSDINLSVDDKNALFIIQGDWIDQGEYANLRGSVIGGLALGGVWSDYVSAESGEVASDIPEDIYCYHIQAQQEAGSHWGFFSSNPDRGCGAFEATEDKGSIFESIGDFKKWKKSTEPTDDDAMYNIAADVCSPTCQYCCEPTEYAIVLGCGTLEVPTANECGKNFEVQWQYRTKGSQGAWQDIVGATEKKINIADYQDIINSPTLNSSSIYEYRPEILELDCISKFLPAVQPNYQFTLTNNTDVCLLETDLVASDGILCNIHSYTWWHKGPRNIWEKIEETSSVHQAVLAGYYYVVVEFGDGLVYTSEEIQVDAGCTVCSMDIDIVVSENVLEKNAVASICTGDTYEIITSASGAINEVYNYSWSTGSIDAGITVEDAGIYTVTVTDEYGCNATASLNLNLYTLPPAQAQIANVVDPDTDRILTCDNSSITLMTETCGGCTYRWTNNQGQTVGETNSIQVDEPSKYTVIVQSADGCTSESAIIISQDVEKPQSPRNTGDIVICQGDDIPDLTVEDREGVEFDWRLDEFAATEVLKTGTSFNPATDLFPGEELAPGIYSYKVTATLTRTGCRSQTTTIVKLKIEPAPNALLNPQEGVICYKDDGATISVDAIEDHDIYWYDVPTGGNKLNEESSNEYEPDVTSGVHNYYAEAVSHATGCKSLTRTLVKYTIHPLPVAPGDMTVEICEDSASPTIAPDVLQEYTVNWYEEDNLISEASRTYVPEVTEAGTYTYKIKTLNPESNCESEIASTVTLIIYPKPAPSVVVTNEGIITCAVTPSIEVSNCDDCLYTWTLDGNAYDGQDMFNVDEPGTYVLSTTKTYGDGTISCDADEVTVTIIEDIVPATTGGSNQVICFGEDAPSPLFDMDDIPAGYTLEWTHVTGPVITQDDTDPSQLNYSSGVLSGGETYEYTFRLRDIDNNCTSPEGHKLTLEVLSRPSKPTLVTTEESLSYCANLNPPVLEVVSTQGVTYNWYDEENTYIISGVTHTPEVEGNYYVEAVDNATMCVSEQLLIELIEENCLAASIQHEDRSSMCPGEPVTLFVDIEHEEGSVSYVWGMYDTDPAIIVFPEDNTDPTITVFPEDNINYLVTVTDDNTEVSDQREIAVESCLSAEIDPDITDQICQGTEVMLTARGENGIPGSNGYTYLWSNGATTKSIKVSPEADTDYTVTIADARTSTVSDDYTINVHPSMTGTLQPSETSAQCPGTAITLTADIEGSVGVVTYQWFNLTDNIELTTEQSNSYTPSPTVTTEYKVVVTDECDKTLELTNTVTVKSCPVININEYLADGVTLNNPELCSGIESNVVATVTGHSGTLSYDWKVKNTSGASIDSDEILNVTPDEVTTIYTLEVTETFDGVETVISKDVTIVLKNCLEDQDISISPCWGPEHDITHDASGGKAPYAYRWNQTENTNGATKTIKTQHPMYDIPLSRNYVLTVTDAIGFSKVVTYIVDPKECITVTVDNIDICEGDSGSLTATISGGNEPYNESWSYDDEHHSVIVTDRDGKKGKDSGYLYEYSISSVGSLSESVSGCFENEETGLSGSINGTRATLSGGGYIKSVELEYIWQSKAPSATTWSTEAGTGKDLSVTNLTSSRDYRRGVRPSVCTGSDDYEYVEISIDVRRNVSDGGTIQVESECSSDNTKVDFEIDQDIGPSGGIGGIYDYEYRWKKDNNSGYVTGWKDDKEVDGSINTNTTATYYREVRMDGCNDWFSSNTVTVGPDDCTPCVPEIDFSLTNNSIGVCSSNDVGIFVRFISAVTQNDNCPCNVSYVNANYKWSYSITSPGEAEISGAVDDIYTIVPLSPNHLAGKEVTIEITIDEVLLPDGVNCDATLTYNDELNSITFTMPNPCPTITNSDRKKIITENENSKIYLSPILLSEGVLRAELIENDIIVWSVTQKEISEILKNNEFKIPVNTDFKGERFLKMIHSDGGESIIDLGSN